MDACTGGANPCMTKNCISCQMACWRCMESTRTGWGWSETGKWCLNKLDDVLVYKTGNLTDAWVTGGQGLGRQANSPTVSGQGLDRQAVIGQWWTRPRQTGGSWPVGRQGKGRQAVHG